MIHNCLACGGILGEPFFSIPDLPLVDSFSFTKVQALSVPTYTIDLCQCVTCKTIQVASPPDTSAIYQNYIYESSSSPDLLNHFSSYAQFVSSIASSLDKPILEIGANDGLLISQLLKVGFKNVYAVDPSPQTALISFPGVTVINNFFSPEVVDNLENNSFSVIIANNCFSHIPNLSSILSLCKNLLTHNGVLIVEVQSTLDLIEGVVFDYIYHEHYFYHTIISFDLLASVSGLEIFSVQHVPTKGGSYRLLLGRPGFHPIDGSVSYWKYREKISSVNTIAPWKEMQDYLASTKQRLQKFIIESKLPLFGYGASATGTVFLRYMGIEDSIHSIVDDNTKRQNTFAPGSGLPVVSLSSIPSSQQAIILAWRHASLIIPKLKLAGIPYLVPLPYMVTHG
ncbi:MAG: methyltransferase domain-containing protein [Alphaproteobacteria bacterium]